MKLKLHISIFFFLLLAIESTVAQQGTRMIEDRISAEKVSELGEGVDILKTKKVWRPRQGFGGDSTTVNSRRNADSQDYTAQKDEIKSPNLGFLSPLFFKIKYAMIILLIISILYLAVQILQHVKDDSDVSVDTEFDEVIEEEDIREMDLDSMLQDALATHNYKLAIRIRFLMLLKKLTDQELIEWSQEKTNRDYIRELRRHPSIDLFKEATLGFELAWYGDQTPDHQEYASFDTLIDRISNSITTYSTEAV